MRNLLAIAHVGSHIALRLRHALTGMQLRRSPSRTYRIARALLVAVALAPAVDTALARSPEDWSAQIRSVVAPGTIQAITMAVATGGLVASIHPDEPIIGLSLNGQHRAYSVYLLNNHEVVNDVVGNEPVVVTWCPLANLAVVYARRVDEKLYSFEASGKLLKNTVVLRDRETDSLWTPASGAAIAGDQKGVRLAEIPSAQKVTWGAWRTMHPDTSIITHGGVASPGFDSYADYHKSLLRTGIHPVKNKDRRLKPKAVVIGVEVDDKRTAYPLGAFEHTKLVSDVFRGLPLLLYFDEATNHTAVYLRTMDDTELEFDTLRPESFRRDSTDIVVDRTTGTSWDLRTGRAVGGALQGDALTPFPFRNAYWFIWADYFPETTLSPRHRQASSPAG